MRRIALVAGLILASTFGATVQAGEGVMCKSEDALWSIYYAYRGASNERDAEKAAWDRYLSLQAQNLCKQVNLDSEPFKILRLKEGGARYFAARYQ